MSQPLAVGPLSHSLSVKNKRELQRRLARSLESSRPRCPNCHTTRAAISLLPSLTDENNVVAASSPRWASRKSQRQSAWPSTASWISPRVLHYCFTDSAGIIYTEASTQRGGCRRFRPPRRARTPGERGRAPQRIQGNAATARRFAPGALVVPPLGAPPAAVRDDIHSWSSDGCCGDRASTPAFLSRLDLPPRQRCSTRLPHERRC
jgi:hypothetical protein